MLVTKQLVMDGRFRLIIYMKRTRQQYCMAEVQDLSYR